VEQLYRQQQTAQEKAEEQSSMAVMQASVNTLDNISQLRDATDQPICDTPGFINQN